jgi:phenylpyruvate tautomerase PptA (4-oxalocrotonate tautomerase family)
MPLLQLHTSVSVPADQRATLVQELSTIVAEAIGKPERYVMVTLAESDICMNGEVGPAAFADVRSIGGLSSGVNQKISAQICAKLQERLAVPPDRTYLNFTDVGRDAWGFNGTTFG